MSPNDTNNAGYKNANDFDRFLKTNYSFKNMEDIKILEVVGLASNKDFQKCVAYIKHVSNNYPRKFGKPYIIPMLEFDWMEYLVKSQRIIGGKLWCIEKPFIVFVNNEFLGNDEDLLNFLESFKICVNLRLDYDCLARLAVYKIYEDQILLKLYSDLVPKTCKNFIKNCTTKKRYKGTRIHRIVKNSWIQFGGTCLGTKSRSCENYKIPHNRRGVLSMCNNGRHKDNTTQFFVTLDPTPWMDYKYVAFGQLVDGEAILRKLENWSTYKEYPDPDKLRIADCGLIDFDESKELKQKDKIVGFFKEKTIEHDIFDPREIPSVLCEKNYRKGKYFFEEDDCTHLPLKNLPSYLLHLRDSNVMELEGVVKYNEEEEEAEYFEYFSIIYEEEDVQRKEGEPTSSNKSDTETLNSESWRIEADEEYGGEEAGGIILKYDVEEMYEG